MTDAHRDILDVIDHWVERGWLRPLDAALARFTAETSTSIDDATLLAAALVAHLEGRGHTCLVLDDAIDDAEALFGWPSDRLDALRFVRMRVAPDRAAWIASLAACDAVAVVDRATDRASDDTPFVLDDERLYLRRYWRHERRIADAVRTRTSDALPVDEAAVREWLDRLFMPLEGGTFDWQKAACAIALRSRLAIVTGGPGTGKTYTAARLLALLLATSDEPGTLRIALAAPTGKAAARLRQSIDAALVTLAPRLGDALPLTDFVARIGPARTLHRLLGARRGSRRFAHDASRPLDVDAVIVDEASMIHVEMMDALLTALPPSARLVLVGDKDQLASVEAGAVLGELCRDAAAGRYRAETSRYVESACGATIDAARIDPNGPDLAQHIVMLRHGERFEGAIGTLADAVNAGDVGAVRRVLASRRSGVAWLDHADADDAVALATRGYATFVDAVVAGPPTFFDEDHGPWVRTVLEAFDRFRVLCAIREGAWGVAGLGRAIEKRLAIERRLPARDGWYEGRPVIATRNDDDAGIYNGDVGVALRTSSRDARLRVWLLDGTGARSIAASRLADVETAFAMTVHRAQGSEFGSVALVLPPDGERVVTRELLYTGITRARETLTLVTARPEIVDEAVARTTRRSSGLAAMLGS